MKKIYHILLLTIIATLAACSDKVIDDLSGTYGDVVRLNLTDVTNNPTVKLKKGLKMLDLNFTNPAGDKLEVQAVATSWTLPAGVYKLTSAPAKSNECSLTANGTPLAGGQLEVNLVEGTYIMSGLLNDAEGKQYVINYRGKIKFEIGVDDPEPSGYTVNLTASPHGYWDYATMSFIPIPRVTKYSLNVTDPDGGEVGYFELLNTDNLSNEQLAGTYPITANATTPGTMCDGYYVPEYFAIGGSYAVAGDGSKSYLSKGSIELQFVDGLSGETLVNIKGDNLEWIGEKGTGTTSVNVPFATVLQKSGTEIKDQEFDSQVLGKKIKYSVLLPKNYDNSKQYPILYMLHGSTGNNNDWLDQGKIAYYTGTADTEMVVVFPQATLDGFDTFYIDGYQGKGVKYETFFFTELMPAVETMFKGNGKRGIAGLSMGGYGSLYYGIKYADKFSGIYACSPAAYVEGCPNLFDMIWTPGASPITVEIGTEDFLYETVKGFNDAMQFSPLLPAFTYIERSGSHDWQFWAACTPKIISFFDSIFSN